MPIIRYTFRHPDGYELTETDLLPRGDDPKQIVLKEVAVFREGADPGFELLKVEVLNPFVHYDHKWTRDHKMGERINYTCAVCGCVAYTVFNNFRGEGKFFNREGKYKSAQYDACRDPLKPMPPSTKLFG